MSLINAYAALDAKAKLKPFHIERREVGANDILIDIEYCGVCHSDIHTARNEWGQTQYPVVPGHEIAGKIAQVGNKVTKFKVGDSVGVGCMVGSCQNCPSCREGLEQYCDVGFVGTYNGVEKGRQGYTYGGYSSKIVVDEKFVLKIPDNIPLDKAAPLLCAGITTFSPLNHWKVTKGSKVAVIGLGGLGHMAVKIAVAMGAEVSVVSSSNKKKEDAFKFGAKEYINSSEQNALNEHLNKFDFILNTVSMHTDLGQYVALLKLDSTMVQVGAPEKPSAINVFPLIFRRRQLAGSLIGGIAETQEMLDFCSKHNVTPEIEIIEMNKINEAYERIIKGDVRYRFVIDIKSLNQD
ncbi:NAD(P)-dependent alcohol dehydrogenase [Fluviispira sanaruensis]|uniref:NAD(P)-dependent alcohol dehydrogenase n=1 Tax=Fluviispira sanaruensis TaxID=2493639 RepID=A0A4P2VIL0_FLUSA|nr:NAD(P)-dependent alcohol dehydrogenase [Fluviispira sanaruensis]BBH52268.1 NAD(P)-dependent alcohol dehydrogenase [Fluviispira sanaruensis]